MAHCTMITEFKFYRSSLGRLDALVGDWLVAMNSCNDGVFTCMFTVHPLNVAFSRDLEYSKVGLSVLNLSQLVCLQVTVNNSD